MRTSALLSLLLVSACAPQSGPLYVTSVQPNLVGMMGCEPPQNDALIVSGFGTIDVAAPPDLVVWANIGGMPQYFQVQSQPPLIVNTGGQQQQIAASGRERLMLQRVVLRYSSRPAIPGLTATVTDTIPRSVPVTPESTRVTMQIPLFGPNALARLAQLSPSNTDTYQFTSTFEIQGVSDPTGAEIKLQPVSMPMTLVKSEVTCAAPNDPRLKRYDNLTARSCTFIGALRRFSRGDCCNRVDASGNPELDLNTPGCDVLP